MAKNLPGDARNAGLISGWARAPGSLLVCIFFCTLCGQISLSVLVLSCVINN